MGNPVLLQQGLWKGLSRSTLHLWVLVVVLSVWPQLQLTQFCLFSGKFRCNRLDYLKKIHSSQRLGFQNSQSHHSRRAAVGMAETWGLWKSPWGEGH